MSTRERTVDSDSARRTERASRETTLCPTLFFAWGSTGAEVLRRLVQRIEETIGTIPPFFAFVAVVPEGSEEEPSYRVELPGADSAMSVVDEDPARVSLEWIRGALRRVTDAGRNAEHATFRGWRTSFERIEVLTIGVLDELSDLDVLVQPLRELAPELGAAAWRVALLWNLPTHGETGVAARDALLEQLDEAQLGADGLRRTNPFDACFLCGPPAAAGMQGLTTTDIVERSVALVREYLLSPNAPALRRALTPRPGPSRFYVGLVERCFEPEHLTDSLKSRWRRAIHDALEGAVGPAGRTLASATPELLGGLAVESLADEDDAVFHTRVESFRDSAIEDALVKATAPGARGRMLATLEESLESYVEGIAGLRSRWEREKEDALRAWRRWGLEREPLREWSHAPVTVADKGRSTRVPPSLSLLLAALGVGLVGVSLALGQALLGILGGIALVVGLLLRFARGAVVRQQPAKVRANPDHERYAMEGARLEERLKRARGFAGTESASSDGEEASQANLLGLELRLSKDLAEVQRLRVRLASEAGTVEDRDGWFVRNLLAPEALDALFRQALARRVPDPADASTDRRVVRALSHRLGASELGELLAQGHGRVLARLDDVGDELLADYAALDAREALEALHDTAGVEGEFTDTFFRELARAAALWSEGDVERQGETLFLAYGPPWDRATIESARGALGAFESAPDWERGRVCLVRLVRGTAWTL